MTLALSPSPADVQSFRQKDGDVVGFDVAEGDVEFAVGIEVGKGVAPATFAAGGEGRTGDWFESAAAIIFQDCDTVLSRGGELGFSVAVEIGGDDAPGWISKIGVGARLLRDLEGGGLTGIRKSLLNGRNLVELGAFVDYSPT